MKKISAYSLLPVILVMLNLQNCTSPPGDITDPNNTLQKTGSAGLTQPIFNSVTPEISSGQAYFNLKRGDSNLIFNLKVVSPDNLQTKDTSNSASQDGAKLAKLSSELGINGQKFPFEIPADKLDSNQAKINLLGLKKGDIVNLETKAMDQNGNVIGSQAVKDKKAEKDIETVDYNITVNTNIGVNVNQNVTQNQTTNVGGSTVIINLPAPPTSIPTQSPSTSGSSTSSGCLKPDPNFLVTLDDGSKVKICTTVGEKGCYTRDQDYKVKLEDGRSFTVCQTAS
jgi:hypothetical protein